MSIHVLALGAVVITARESLFNRFYISMSDFIRKNLLILRISLLAVAVFVVIIFTRKVTCNSVRTVRQTEGEPKNTKHQTQQHADTQTHTQTQNTKHKRRKKTNWV